MADAPPALLERHREELIAQAIDAAVIDAVGVRSVERPDELPEGVPEWWKNHLPAKLYPWRLNGHVEYQLAPDDRSQYKYLFREDATVPLDCVRDVGEGPVLLVEGTKQHLAAASYAPKEFAIYGMFGCWGWAEADLSFLTGRPVWVAFDADFRTNRDVYDAAAALRDSLEIHGIERILFVQIPGPGSQGLDDFLAKLPSATRPDTLGRLLEKAAEELPKRAPAKRRKREIGTFFGENGLLVETLCKAIYRRSPAALTVEERVALYIDGAFRIHRAAFLATVGELLGEENRPAHRAAAEEHMVGLLERTGRKLPDRTADPILNVANGMLDLRTGELAEHDPKYLSSIQFPVEWDADALCPRFDAWLEQVIPDQADALMEAASQVLDPSRTPHKALLLYGPARSGKSTFLRILEAIVGEEARASVSLHQLAENRFAAAAVFGKKLNTAADLSARHVEDLSTFKMLTGEDSITAERKNQQLFSFTNRALFAFSANDVPTVGEVSRAYIERIRPFKFGRSFIGHEDQSIEDAIMAELPGILVRLVRAWQQWQQRNAWLPTPMEVQAEFEQRSNRVRLWVSEHATVWPAEGLLQPPDQMTTPRDLYRSFKHWLEDSGATRMGERKFLDHLLSIDGVHEVRSKTNKIRGYNVTIRQDGPDAPGSGGRSGTFASSYPMSGVQSGDSEGTVNSLHGVDRVDSATFATATKRGDPGQEDEVTKEDIGWQKDNPSDRFSAEPKGPHTSRGARRRSAPTSTTKAGAPTPANPAEQAEHSDTTSSPSSDLPTSDGSAPAATRSMAEWTEVREDGSLVAETDAAPEDDTEHRGASKEDSGD